MASSARSRGGAQIIPRPAHVVPGPSAPWRVGVPVTLGAVVASIPAAEREIAPRFENARHSAVLVALADGETGPEVLLTRRSWELRNHRGEISFPGGRVDPGETSVQAALREAYEEVGLNPTTVHLVGELSHINTFVSRSYIVPKVATLEARPALTGQTMEVDRVLWVPLAELTASGVYHSEVWGLETDRGMVDRTLHFFELADETVWGATAHILVELLAGVLAPGWIAER